MVKHEWGDSPERARKIAGWSSINGEIRRGGGKDRRGKLMGRARRVGVVL
jgi:hypothetical protein